MLRSSGGSWHRRGNHSWASPPGGSGAMGSSLELTASRLSLAPSLQLAYGVAGIQAVQHRDDAVPAAAICSHMPGLCMGIVHGACMACTRALYQACACNVHGLCVARERLSTHSKLPLACRCRTALAGEARRGQRWRPGRRRSTMARSSWAATHRPRSREEAPDEAPHAANTARLVVIACKRASRGPDLLHERGRW